MAMENSMELSRWISDRLISHIGYSKPIVVKYVLRLLLSKEITSTEKLAGKLAGFGLSPYEALVTFAEEVSLKISPNVVQSSCLYQYYRELKKLTMNKRAREDDVDDEEQRYNSMPETYDQDRRFSVAKVTYSDENKQMAWDDVQLKMSKLSFGSKNRKLVTDYDFLFNSLYENSTNLVQVSTMKGDYDDDDERKGLPIHGFRDQLVEAIRNHQVVVIVGETGCGKTTQIPQFLHQAGYSEFGIIGCTQPHRVTAMSVAAKVALDMGIKLGHEVGYSVPFEDCTSNKTVLKYMTDEMLLRELLHDHDLTRYSVLMVDEAHERTVSTDILLGLLKSIARHRPNLKLLISSATLDDAIKFCDFFDNAPVFEIPARRFPVEIFYSRALEPDYLDVAIVTALRIHFTEADGDILVFLTEHDEIERAVEILKNKVEIFGSRIPELIICPIFGNLPMERQNKIFEATPKGSRKVVLATNIAETSLAINGIRYVIDCGYCKMKSCDTNIAKVAQISKASAIQRAGRAGRTGLGKCFRLYTYFVYNKYFPETTTPEIQRTNLSAVVLTLKTLGLFDLENFDFMDPLPTEALMQALEHLFALGALNKNGELTKIGRLMSEFPLNPMLSKTLVTSIKYNCSDEIVTLAAMLSAGHSIFYCPKDKKLLADNARKNFSRDKAGDHIALLNVYRSWKENGYSSQWCYDNFVQLGRMKKAKVIREELEGIMDRLGIKMKSNFGDVESIKKSITSGFFFNNSAMLQSDGSYRTYKLSHTVFIHPTSSLSEKFPKWVIYNELILTTKKFLLDVTKMKPGWLHEIAPHF